MIAALSQIWEQRVAGPIAKSAVAFIGVVAFAELAFGRDSTTDVLGVPVPTAVPAGIILQGIIIGCLYALIAFGLILIYRANRLVSFAQAGLGSVPAVLALLLLAAHHWPYLVAVAIRRGDVANRRMITNSTRKPVIAAPTTTIATATR